MFLFRTWFYLVITNGFDLVITKRKLEEMFFRFNIIISIIKTFSETQEFLISCKMKNKKRVI